MTNQKPSFVYSVKDAAEIINHPLANTQLKMFKFLRRYGVLDDMMPKPEQIVQERFTMEFRLVKKGNFTKTVSVVKISQKGISFIQKLIKLVYG